METTIIIGVNGTDQAVALQERIFKLFPKITWRSGSRHIHKWNTSKINITKSKDKLTLSHCTQRKSCVGCANEGKSCVNIKCPSYDQAMNTDFLRRVLEWPKSEPVERPKARKEYVVSVRNQKKSEQVQEALFRLGYAWTSGKQDILTTGQSYLYIHSAKTLTYASSHRYAEDAVENFGVQWLSASAILQRRWPGTPLSRAYEERHSFEPKAYERWEQTYPAPKPKLTIQDVRAIIRQTYDPYGVKAHPALIQAHKEREEIKLPNEAKELVRALVGPEQTYEGQEEQ